MELACRLLALEAARRGSHRATSDLAQVCERLRLVITPLAGSAGFHSLLARALALAKADHALLKPIKVLENGTIVGFDSGDTQDADAAAGLAAAKCGLVSQLLDLLTILIGEQLTMRLVRDAWPELSAKSIGLQSENKS